MSPRISAIAVRTPLIARRRSAMSRSLGERGSLLPAPLSSSAPALRNASWTSGITRAIEGGPS
jgi:hypothetical protein